MFNPNNQRVMKIMELLEQTQLFTSDKLTTLEDYLLADEADKKAEELALGDIGFQDLSTCLSHLKPKMNSLFNELWSRGGNAEAEKLGKILFAVGQSTSRNVIPLNFFSSTNNFLSSEPAKKAALYGAHIGHTDHLFRTQSIRNVIQMAEDHPEYLRQAIEYQKEEEGNGRLILLAAYFLLKYPNVNLETITEVSSEDAEWMDLYENILKNSLEDFPFKNTSPQTLQNLVEEDDIDDRLSGMSPKGKVNQSLLSIVGGTAYINFPLSARIKNVVKLCFAAGGESMFNVAASWDARGCLSSHGDKLDRLFCVNIRTYLEWAAKKDRTDVLKAQFLCNREQFMRCREKAEFAVGNKMIAVVRELDPELYKEDCAKEAGRQQKTLIDSFVGYVDSNYSKEVRAYLSGEAGVDSLFPIEDKLLNQWRWSYIPWQTLENYKKAYGNDSFCNRCETLLALCGGLTNYYYLQDISKAGAKGVKRMFALMESEGLLLRHQIAAYVNIEESGYYCTKEWKDIFRAEAEKVFQKHLEEQREETLAAFRAAESVGRSFGLKVLAKDPQKNKAEILSFTQDTAKGVKDVLLPVLYEAKDWKEDIIALLSSKKAGDRDIAVRVLVKWDNEAYAPLILAALEKEKNAKVRALMESVLRVEGQSGAQSLDQADFVKEIHKGNRKRALAWAYETPFSKVHKKSGEEAEEEYLQAILLCYSTMDSYGVSPNAAMLAEALDENELAIYANELFDKWMEAGAESKKRWVLYASAIHGGNEIIKKLQHQIQEWPQAARGAIAAEAVQALALNPKPQALLIVDGISRKFKFKQVKAAAEKALEFAASQLGITTEELADRIVPDLGFDETMKRVFDYGERRFTVTITPSLEVEVFDENGKKLKNLPSPGKRDDEAKATAAYEEFKQMKKQMKATVSSQKLRLEMALSTERRWSVEAWKNLFVKNPIMHQFAIGLVWGIYEDKKLTASFRYMEDGSFNTEDEDEFELPESAEQSKDGESGEQAGQESIGRVQLIGLVHPIELSKESLETWKQQMEDYEITQPIEQLDRAVYYRTAEEENQNSLERFGGCILNDLSLGGKLLGAGWYRGSVQDAGGFYTYYREDPELGLGVELHFSGSFVGGTNEDVTVYDARFYKAGTVKRGSYEYDEVDDEKAYLLKDVPERYFSEIVLQISKATASSKEKNANWKKESR